MIKHTLLTLLLALALIAAFALPAYALNVSGGNAHQQQWVEEAIWSAAWPNPHTIDSHFGGINVKIVPENPPYWQIVGTASPREIRLSQPYFDSHGLHAQAEVAIHEWAHQVWYAIGSNARGEWNDWYATHSNPDPQQWIRNPAESFAEQLRVAAWPSKYYNNTKPRTSLPVWEVGKLKEFVLTNSPTTTTTTSTTTTTVPPSTTTTTTIVPPSTTTTTVSLPFPDIPRSDMELVDAAKWGKSEGLFQGYSDGTFGPWEPMLVRHVALVATRGGYSAPIGWIGSYLPALRRDVHTAFPELQFKEERWGEEITRSQVLRLLWRER